MDLRKELFKAQDLKYRDFHKSLVPTVNEEMLIGVRLPEIRKIAKAAYRENAENRLEYYEEIMVYGLTLSLKKCTAQEHMEDLKRFVPLIDNWAVCDTCVSSFKFTNKYKKEMYGFVKSYIGKGEYETRFAVVMLMCYYLDDEYIDGVLEILKGIKSDNYYINMAVAWALSVAFVKYREKTLSLLEENSLSKDVQNKTIRKIRESYRVSKEDKEYVKALKAG
ncbi:MAG: DNA alkylation repair protein [Eubacterium sp.]|nr:DNA alkylation repair protein [Eubacterium sp.]